MWTIDAEEYSTVSVVLSNQQASITQARQGILLQYFKCLISVG